MKSPILTAVGATLLAAALPLAGCASTPTAAAASTDAKSGEGSCGGEKKTEGSCGGEKKTEGSCGEGSCGEGSCGGSKTTTTPPATP